MVQAARVEHDVEGRRCLVLDDVALAKLDLDAALLGARPGSGEGGRDEVDRNDGEPLLREVHSVAALAAAKVERASAARPLRDRALQQRGRLLAMPWQSVKTSSRDSGRWRTLRAAAGPLHQGLPQFRAPGRMSDYAVTREILLVPLREEISNIMKAAA